jgi:hypothetical protein
MAAITARNSANLNNGSPYSRSFGTQLNDKLMIYEDLKLGSVVLHAILSSCDYKQGSHVLSESILIGVYHHFLYCTVYHSLHLTRSLRWDFVFPVE